MFSSIPMETLLLYNDYSYAPVVSVKKVFYRNRYGRTVAEEYPGISSHSNKNFNLTKTMTIPARVMITAQVLMIFSWRPVY